MRLVNETISKWQEFYESSVKDWKYDRESLLTAKQKGFGSEFIKVSKAAFKSK